MAIPELNSVPVVVTGGAGFIGSHLVDALLDRGAIVTVLDDFSTGREQNLEAVRSRIRIVRGDIRDPDACREAIRESKYVFHQAARGSVPRSMTDPVATIDVNVRGTATVFAAGREAGPTTIVYASSSSVYGDSAALPKREGEEGRPLSPYALSKAMDEQLADVFHRCYGMRLVGLRYFNVFGPRQSPEGPYAAVIPRFFAAALDGRPPQIYGTGEQSRDFTFVADVVTANLLAAGAPEIAAGSAVNVAPGGRTTVSDLANEIVRLCGSAALPEHLPPRPGDVLHSQADGGRAHELFGFKPEWRLAAGLAMTHEWHVGGRAAGRPDSSEPPAFSPKAGA